MPTFRVRVREMQLVDYFVEADDKRSAAGQINGLDFHERTRFNNDVIEDQDEITEVEEVEDD